MVSHQPAKFDSRTHRRKGEIFFCREELSLPKNFVSSKYPHDNVYD